MKDIGRVLRGVGSGDDVEGLSLPDTVPVLDIVELPAPVHAWDDASQEDELAVIEADLRQLLRRVAEGEFTISERQKAHRAATRRLLLSVIEAVDAFERVFASISAQQEAVTPRVKRRFNNFRTIQRLLEKALTVEGVVPTHSVEGSFDPHWHEVGERIDDRSKPEGTIVEELKRGYAWQNELLRRAEVAVVHDGGAET